MKQFLEELIELRRSVSKKIIHRLKSYPNDKQSLVALHAKQNGIQDCINKFIKCRRKENGNKCGSSNLRNLPEVQESEENKIHRGAYFRNNQ